MERNSPGDLEAEAIIRAAALRHLEPVVAQLESLILINLKNGASYLHHCAAFKALIDSCRNVAFYMCIVVLFVVVVPYFWTFWPVNPNYIH